ncbi:hypothetical protein BH23GEM9_BH23GEM9_12670 [soil metagenome]
MSAPAWRAITRRKPGRTAILAMALSAYAACSEGVPPASTGKLTDSTNMTLDEYAGCYKLVVVAVDLDDPWRRPSVPVDLPDVFELMSQGHEPLPGYQVLGVPRRVDGSPSAAGAWTAWGDSIVVVWKTAIDTYALTLALGGDTLKGSWETIRLRHRRSSPVVFARQPCEGSDMVPAASGATGAPGDEAAGRPRVSTLQRF